MNHRNQIALVGLAAAALVAGVAPDADAAGQARGRPLRAKTHLAVPAENPPDADARGVVDVKYFPVVGRRAERSWLRFKLGRLEPDTQYTLWIDDPATEEVDLTQVGDAFTTHDRGRVRVRFDTKHGEALPFDATLAVLGGLACEIRTGDGLTTILSGNLPAVQ